MTDQQPRASLSNGDALIVVDVQNDFLPAGRLAVPGGDGVVAPLNRYVDAFQTRGLPIIATRDWHPANHCSFAAHGGPWPPHCISESEGARFAPTLALPPETIVISKGTEADREAYSGFEGTDLAVQLRRRRIQRVFVGGLATDYCVLNTVKDAIRSGCEVYLLTDAIRAVDVEPDDGAKAEAEMRRLGAKPITSATLAT